MSFGTNISDAFAVASQTAVTMTTSDHTNDPHLAPHDEQDVGAQVDEFVCSKLAQCTYSHSFSKIQWKYANGTLTLQGRVASFYLKQILLTLMRNCELIERISDQVDVVSATGLSSERGSRG